LADPRSADHVDWSKAQGRGSPTEAVHDRHFAAPAAGLLDRIKIAANKRDVRYQSLIEVWLAEKLDAE
jgi:hypothetical protein